MSVDKYSDTASMSVSQTQILTEFLSVWQSEFLIFLVISLRKFYYSSIAKKLSVEILRIIQLRID